MMKNKVAFTVHSDEDRNTVIRVLGVRDGRVDDIEHREVVVNEATDTLRGFVAFNVEYDRYIDLYNTLREFVDEGIVNGALWVSEDGTAGKVGPMSHCLRETGKALDSNSVDTFL